MLPRIKQLFNQNAYLRINSPGGKCTSATIRTKTKSVGVPINELMIPEIIPRPTIVVKFKRPQCDLNNNQFPALFINLFTIFSRPPLFYITSVFIQFPI